MSFPTSIVFYLLIGSCVAVALYLHDELRTGREQAFRVASCTFFWPLYLPLLLERPTDSLATSRAEARAIEQVESELDAALGSLDGWAEEALADEGRRLQELRSAWRSQAERIRQLDALLADSSGANDYPLTPETAATSSPPPDRRLRSDHARAANIRRLHELRERLLG